MAPCDIKMMASLVLNSIRSSLNAVERSEIWYMYCFVIKYMLKNLEVFVLCTRKLGNDAQLRFDDGKVCTLASLLQMIHHALPATPYNWDSHTLDNFQSAIANLKKEISAWHSTLLVSLPQPTFDEVTDTIDSVLEILDFLSHSCAWSITPPIEAMIEKITFLRNFIRFATPRSIESPQLLAHIHAVAVDAAHTSFMYFFPEYDVEEEYDVELNIPVLLQGIKMVDPQVDETYTQVLTSAKLSAHLLSPITNKDPDPSVIMKDFIDSLLWNLWERLHTDTPTVISMNSELGLVYKGLRLLRSMLKEQPNKFYQRVGELTKIVICDAGILIFSLYQRDMEIDVPASGLLQRINRITQIVKGKDFSIPDLLQIGQGLSDINMMASLVLYSIRYSLNDLERSENYIFHDRIWNMEMKHRLKNLELFVLCTRKLGNDAQLRFYDGQVCTLASLLQRILGVLPATHYNSDEAHAIYNFKKEIGGWYDTLLVSLPQPTSFDELNDIIDSLLDNLNLISSFCETLYCESSVQPIEALIGKIRFLRNFIRFATLLSVEPPLLLAHIQAFAVDAAHTSFMYIFPEYGVELNILALLQMIKVVDPQVDETYTQSLTSAKLSTHLLSLIPDKDPDPSVIMKDFIDSLLWNLWERLHKDIPIVISTNSEVRLVYEGLRLLRSMLKEQPKKFDKRIGELTRVMICDAGILIFSLYQRDMEIVVPASGLLQRINRITQIAKGKDFSIPDLLQRIGRVAQIVTGNDFSIPDFLQWINGIGQGLSDINMMASLVLYSIRYVLNDLERSEESINRYERVLGGGISTKWKKLKNLELFVLCARKLGNDAQLRFDDGKVTTLASLFQRIQDALPRNPPPYNEKILEKFEGTIANLKEEIGGWYTTLLVSLTQPTSFDEVTAFIDSLLEHLNGLISDGSLYSCPPSAQKIRFLRNFICFATLRRVEPPQSLDKLLAHIQAVAVDAAHTCLMYYEGDEDEKPNIPVLLRMIKMDNHQVDETYTQALTSAKLSTHLLFPIPDKDHDPSVIMKDFIDSLLWNLWERLHLDTPIVISSNSELQLVYEDLRLLRTMLEAQPNKFDKGIGEPY